MQNRIVLALALIGFSTSAFAASTSALSTTTVVPLVDASDPSELMNLMQAHGDASVEHDEFGDPVIIGRYNGAVYTVTFYGCDGGQGCRDVIFHAAWENNGVDIIALNDWNSRSRYGKAFFDEMGDPTIEMAVNLNWGVTQANFKDTIEWWFASMHHFSSEIGY